MSWEAHQNIPKSTGFSGKHHCVSRNYRSTQPKTKTGCSLDLNPCPQVSRRTPEKGCKLPCLSIQPTNPSLEGNLTEKGKFQILRLLFFFSFKSNSKQNKTQTKTPSLDAIIWILTASIDTILLCSQNPQQQICWVTFLVQLCTISDYKEAYILGNLGHFLPPKWYTWKMKPKIFLSRQHQLPGWHHSMLPTKSSLRIKTVKNNTPRITRIKKAQGNIQVSSL